MSYLIQKMKEVSVTEEKKLGDIRLGKVVPNILEEVNIPDVPGSCTMVVNSMKIYKKYFYVVYSCAQAYK